MNAFLRLAFFFAFAVVSAIFFPWWTTAVVAGLGVIFLALSLRWVTALTLLAWVLACAGRDVANGFGPSRVFARLLRLDSTTGLSTNASIGAAIPSLMVYLIVGTIGALIALAAASLAKHLRLVTARLAGNLGANNLEGGTSAD